MADSLPIQGVGSTGSVTGPAGAGARRTPVPAGQDFASLVRQQLEKVNAMQSEADTEVRKLLTGESQNLTEVFTAARKAEVAFSLLMEIRNKLVDAYQEIKNLRV